jgi:hypothetical protein
MDVTFAGIRTIYASFTDMSIQKGSVKEMLLAYTRALEAECQGTMDISLFIFGLRSFFCWHGASEVLRDGATIKEIQGAWLLQNDDAYSEWLRSADDALEGLKWEKWVFQAKMSILEELVTAAVAAAAGAPKPAGE